MGGHSAPAAPNYGPEIAQQNKIMQQDLQMQQQQQQWAQNQWRTIQPYEAQYLQNMSTLSGQEAQWSAQDQQRYQSIYAPIQDAYATTAVNWDTPARESQQAGMAMADVSGPMEQARTAALSQLEGYGVDPSSTRFGALDLGSRIQQAAATAQAGTQSRINTQLQGLQLEANAIGQGQALNTASLGESGAAQGTGAAGIGTTNQTIGTGASTMGTGTQWGSMGQNANLAGANLMGMGFDQQLQAYQAQQNAGTSLGGAIGGALGELGGGNLLSGAGSALGLTGFSGSLFSGGGIFDPIRLMGGAI